MPPTLYMIPTPIGQTPSTENRAVIERLEYFVVENVRTARRLLSSLKLGRPIEELHFEELSEHTKPEEVEGLLGPLLEGHDMGMLSEAGAPGVADPGAELVAACHRRGIRVVPLVGPSSILLALMASGQCGQSFAFNGYLPVKPPERVRAIRHFERRALSEGQTQVFIEAPYRNNQLLGDLLATCAPATRLTVAVDLTDPKEYIRTMSVADWRQANKPELHKRPAIFIIGV